MQENTTGKKPIRSFQSIYNELLGSCIRASDFVIFNANTWYNLIQDLDFAHIGEIQSCNIQSQKNDSSVDSVVKVDKIDSYNSSLESSFIKLPIDVDGIPIKLGDLLEYKELDGKYDGISHKVLFMTCSEICGGWYLELSGLHGRVSPNRCRHLNCFDDR